MTDPTVTKDEIEELLYSEECVKKARPDESAPLLRLNRLENCLAPRLARDVLELRAEVERLRGALERMPHACVSHPHLPCPGCYGAKALAAGKARGLLAERCACQLEAGDSSCPVHGDHECESCGEVYVEARGHTCSPAGKGER